MRVISASLQNFASYKSLKFDFLNQGLTLIEGPTGSGKSTLCDVIPWIAFGVTAKNGPVSDVLSWPGGEVTSGALHLEIRDTALIIKRTRGPKAKDNDLYYYEVGGPITRGKDLNDTQKLIDNLLGMDSDLYLAGAYYHEFSQTAQFFTTTAKHRRAICEQVVDLSLAKDLQEKLAEKWKTVKSTLHSNIAEIASIDYKIQVLSRMQETEDRKASAWALAQSRAKIYVGAQYDSFETNRKQVISNKCNSCGTTLAAPKTIINDSPNPYLERLAELEQAVNPHGQSVADYTEEILLAKDDLLAVKAKQDAINIELLDLELLQQVTADYRSTSIQRIIQNIESRTNTLLTDHFDAEIRVAFSAQETDRLEVEITKDGNKASFQQLSKGQRQMLKLCFGVSVMHAIQNHHGLKFEQIFFDEALDGLSEELKIKSISLFEKLSLEHGSVFLVEHSTEVKTRLDNKYTVSLVNGTSQIEKNG